MLYRDLICAVVLLLSWLMAGCHHPNGCPLQQDRPTALNWNGVIAGFPARIDFESRNQETVVTLSIFAEGKTLLVTDFDAALMQGESQLLRPVGTFPENGELLIYGSIGRTSMMQFRFERMMLLTDQQEMILSFRGEKVRLSLKQAP